MGWPWRRAAGTRTHRLRAGLGTAARGAASGLALHLPGASSSAAAVPVWVLASLSRATASKVVVVGCCVQGAAVLIQGVRCSAGSLLLSPRPLAPAGKLLVGLHWQGKGQEPHHQALSNRTAGRCRIDAAARTGLSRSRTRCRTPPASPPARHVRCCGTKQGYLGARNGVPNGSRRRLGPPRALVERNSASLPSSSHSRNLLEPSPVASNSLSDVSHRLLRPQHQMHCTETLQGGDCQVQRNSPGWL